MAPPFGLRASVTVPFAKELRGLPILIDLASPVELRAGHRIAPTAVPWNCFARSYQGNATITAIGGKELRIQLEEDDDMLWIFGRDQSKQTAWQGKTGATFPSGGGVDFMAFLPDRQGHYGEAQITFTVTAFSLASPPPEEQARRRTTDSFPSLTDLLLEQPEWAWVAYAENPACPPDLLHALASIPWVPLQAAVALNPTTPTSLVAGLSFGYPSFVLANPALDFMVLEDPSMGAFSPIVASAWRARFGHQGA